MPLCPHCNRDANRRKKGNCPFCGEQVFTLRLKNKTTIWLAAKTSAAELLTRAEEHIERVHRLPDFSFGEPGESQWLAQAGAASTLLARCQYDQKLALTVIDAYFQGDRRLIPPKTMFGVIGKQFPVALSIARHRMQRKEKEEAAEDMRLRDLESEMTYADLFTI